MPQTLEKPVRRPDAVEPHVRAAVPSVSVLMTAYNGDPRYLRAAVESILAQSLADFELVVIDDGSTDGTLAVLHEFERRDSRVRLFERPHLGYVRQLNFGLRQCRGEFVARMDADDVALPERLEKQVDLLRREPLVAVVGGGYELVDGAGRLLRIEHPPTDDAAFAGALFERPHADLPPAGDDSQERADRRPASTTWASRRPRTWTCGCASARSAAWRACRTSCSNIASTPGASARRGRSSRVRRSARAWKRRTADVGWSGRSSPRRAWRPVGEAARYGFLCQYGWWAPQARAAENGGHLRPEGDPQAAADRRGVAAAADKLAQADADTAAL